MNNIRIKDPVYGGEDGYVELEFICEMDARREGHGVIERIYAFPQGEYLVYSTIYMGGEAAYTKEYAIKGSWVDNILEFRKRQTNEMAN